MNIRAKVNHLVDLQDNITHRNESGRDLGTLPAQRTALCNEIVEYVAKLEDRVKELEQENTPLTDADIAAVREFSQDMGYSVRLRTNTAKEVTEYAVKMEEWINDLALRLTYGRLNYD